MAKLGRPGPLMMPVHLTIEPTNACNLRCPVCETGNGSLSRAKGMLDPDVYRAFIDQVAPTTAVLMFYFMGEPFLNKHAYDMIHYARRKGIYVETCTNGDFVDAKGVIYSDVNEISFQIGGMTQATHEMYRVRGDLGRIQANLCEVLRLRAQVPESHVQVNVGFVVMRHNEHEIPDFLRWARSLGVDCANVIDPCVRTVAEGHALLPTDRKY
ncbi:MAG: radical SAM superfamily protein [Rhodospirillaceae bacterium]|nr:MAG: radical SAM superfamily protein [Rhodospirillaceae bacterium]